MLLLYLVCFWISLLSFSLHLLHSPALWFMFGIFLIFSSLKITVCLCIVLLTSVSIFIIIILSFYQVNDLSPYYLSFFMRFFCFLFGTYVWFLHFSWLLVLVSIHLFHSWEGVALCRWTLLKRLTAGLNNKVCLLHKSFVSQTFVIV